jgi:hypothetical protein
MDTAEKSAAPSFAVSLVMTPSLAGELQADKTVLDLKDAYTIAGTADERRSIAAIVNAELQRVKQRIAYFKKQKDSFVAPAEVIIGNAKALFDPTIKACIEFEAFLKTQLLDQSQYEQKLIEEAKAKRAEEERAARQKAEQEAAAARARAEEQAAAARKLAEEAEAKRIAAVAEGNKRAAAAAAAEKAKQEEKANSALENGEAKAQELQLAASAAPVTQVQEQPKLAGFSTRENWVAELALGMTEEEAKYAIACAIAGGRRDLLPLLDLDMPAANRLAKAQRKNMNAPGLVAVNRPIAASRAA